MTDEAADEADLEGRLKKLDALQREMISTCKALFDQNRAMYVADFYAFGAMRRALALIKGFKALITDQNFLCAAPLVRMQLDSALRVFALSLVADRDAVVQEILRGTPLSKLKDDDGNKMRDAYLVQKLSETYPWVSPLYSETSGFVHLSERHFFSSITATDDTTQTFTLVVSAEDHGRVEQDYFEIVDAFFESTRLTGLVVAGYLMARAMRATPATPPG